ncbi:MAG TPA: ABC transporter ATP-binding protein [bacterium]|nr:ABC transporter ATP-binding protein [bacterium]
MIQLQHLTKHYPDTVAVDDFSLTIDAGELMVLLGASGCGKTTTLKIINRLVEPTGGDVLINGRSHTSYSPVELRRSIGYVFQGIGLFPHMTVAENIGIVPRLIGWPRERRTDRVTELLHLFHMEPETFRNRRPSELSGGQQQRVGVARALATEPSIMLMDEPFGALDPLTRVKLQEEYQSIRRQLGITTIFVTHDMTEALLLGDRIAVMDAGGLVQAGTPRELLTAPANDYVRRLMDTPKSQAEKLDRLMQSS